MRLQDAIQTVIKTKYASFLARREGDQWEIGLDMRNVCFCYRQPTLMFLIGLKWMGSSRVLKWKGMWGREREINRDRKSKSRYYFQSPMKVLVLAALWSFGLVVSTQWTELDHTPSMSTQTDQKTTVQWLHEGEGGKDKEGGKKAWNWFQ